MLQRLTLDNPHHQTRIATLRQLTGKKFDELAQMVAMARAGRAEAAKTLVLSDTGLLLMDEIRNVARQMQSEEDHLDVERSLHYEKGVATTFFVSTWLAL